MFHALVEATATDAGFAQIKDVFAERLVLKDHCESFLLAETCAVSLGDSSPKASC